MGLKDLQISLSYETTENSMQLLDDFYNPVLEQATEYYRVVAFFSSTALSVAAKGIEGLVHNNGNMYLLISPKLSEDDYKVIEEHGTVSEKMSVFSDFDLSDIPNDNLKLLAWLLDTGHLEIKIAVVNRNFNSLFHQKVGIIKDLNGDMISFSGSINETAQAWISNVEEFKVFKSWEPGQIDYLNSDLSKFLEYWKNKRPEIAKVYDIPESVREKIVEIKPAKLSDVNSMRKYKREKKTHNDKFNLFPHQKKAIEAWISNGYSLLIEMATGTGKTRTAIGCVAEKLKDGETLLTIIATPQITISQQWQNEIKELNVQFDKEVIIDGSVVNWEKDFRLLLLDLSNNKIKTAIIFTTVATASSDKFVRTVRKAKYDTKILFIGDEVHTMGSAKQKNALQPIYEYRIGLSATPERAFDDEGTQYICEYFGNKSFEFSIADALKTINPITGKPFLNPYKYYPVFVKLTDPESKLYEKYSKKIAIILNKKENNENYDPEELERLYEKRADIVKNASDKISAFEDLIRGMDPANISDMLVFASDKQIERCFEVLGSLKVKRAKITMKESASKVVTKEGLTERQNIIKQFAQHEIQVLVGIKCLDEGIDIPNARIAVLLSSSTNNREYIQRVGRVIRQTQNKPMSEIYDLIVFPDDTEKFHEILETEENRVVAIAQNAVNYEEVKNDFRKQGVDIDAD